MRPVLFRWHGHRIHSYPVMLYVGLVLGVAAGIRAARLEGLDAGRTCAALVLLTIPALVGARLLFVAIHWRLYRREPHRVWRRGEQGGAMLGGLPPALLASLPVLALLHVPFAAFWDAATFTLLVGMIVTRAGCLLNGCCGGRPTSGWFGMYLPDHRGVWRRRLPTQVLEAGWALLLLVSTIALWSRRPFAGAVFLIAVAAYAVGRVALEPTRDVQDRVGPVNVQQAISVAFASLATSGLLVAWLRAG
jgi:phosphatidylglycerol:prolipoprotein diacylglycerol transferase